MSKQYSTSVLVIPYAFSEHITLMWDWVWFKYFDVDETTPIPHLPLCLSTLLGIYMQSKSLFLWHQRLN